jgi:hypothetical protein
MDADMSQSIRPRRVNHMNAVLLDFDASVDHFRKLYDAEFVVDIPQREFHACLIEMGRVLFELFVPHDQLVIARYGPHYVGIEYEADMGEVRKAIAARGIRIIRDIGIAVHTHPADCFGVSFEFTDQYFHDRDWPLLGGPMKPAEYWRQHPLGLAGLKGYVIAVSELDAARDFLQSFLGAAVVYEEPRPAVAARAVGLRIADAVVELITPRRGGNAAAASPPVRRWYTLDGVQGWRHRTGRSDTSPSAASSLCPATHQTPGPCPRSIIRA